jgi:hypothetical protein
VVRQTTTPVGFPENGNVSVVSLIDFRISGYHNRQSHGNDSSNQEKFIFNKSDAHSDLEELSTAATWVGSANFSRKNVTDEPCEHQKTIQCNESRVIQHLRPPKVQKKAGKSTMKQKTRHAVSTLIWGIASQYGKTLTKHNNSCYRKKSLHLLELYSDQN